MLLSGGSATVNDLTGMNIVAAILLLPLGVVIYTLFGGIKATFLTDYAHTVVLIVIIFIFAFTTWATSSKLGSPQAVWGNSYQVGRIKSKRRQCWWILFYHAFQIWWYVFVINIIGNFGTVFLDNGYFNKAFAANPLSTYKGYILEVLHGVLFLPCVH